MKITTFRNFGLALAATVAVAAPARADQTFDFSVPVSGWTVDRSAPAGFTAPVNTNELMQSIREGDYKGPGSFYNTQGMAHSLETGTFAAQIQVYVDPTWTLATGNDPVRYAGFWGVGTSAAAIAPNNPDGITTYPIIEVVANTNGFDVRTWDSSDPNGGWSTLTSLGAGWQTLGYTLSGGHLSYTVNGTVIGTAPGLGTEQFSSVILQGYNAGADYDIRWRDLQTINSAVPEPASLVSAAIGLGAAGFFAARRRRGKVAA